jgi:hypothetical protein
LEAKPAASLIKSIFKDATPVRLRLFLFGNTAAAVLFALVSMTTVSQHRHALDTVGHYATPSVVAANRLQIGLMQMDGRLADELVVRDNLLKDLIRKDFETGRRIVSQQLVAAASNITYGDDERIPIEKIQLDLGKYEMEAQRTRDLATDAVTPLALDAYRTASNTACKSLIPNAKSLAQTNIERLEECYSSEKSKSSLTCGLVLLLGLVLLGVLALTQIYLRKHFRRRVSFPLLLASILTIVFVNNINSELRESASRLKHAKEDSYDSAVAILTAQSSLYAANAAQSRYILDREHSAQHEKEFFSHLESIAKFTPGHDFVTSIAVAQREMRTDTQKLNIPGLSGALAIEFANMEYDGEAKAALETLSDLNEFVLADQKMRAAEKSGKHEDAVKLCLGYEPGRVKSCFMRLDESLTRVLKINQEHFESQIVNASEDLAAMATLAQIFAGIIIFCTYLGLSPRMREYL